MNIMQIRERNEEGMGALLAARGSRLAAHHSPLVRSRDVRSIALTMQREEKKETARSLPL